MKAESLALLISELKNGGPSPFAADVGKPMPITFQNEMDMLSGESMCSVFGKQEMVSVIATSFRLILYLSKKRGSDQCRSYWHKVNFGDWRWEEPDGFVISSIELTKPEFGAYETHEKFGPTASWATYLVDPDGERRLLEEVVIHLTRYHFHQENRFAPWDEFISPGSVAIGGKERNPAATLFGAKLKFSTDHPGVVDLEALMQLMEDPFQASGIDGGDIPEESLMHPSKATRETENVGVSKVLQSRTGNPSKLAQARKAITKGISVGSQVKGSVETAQKVASLVEGSSKDAKKILGAGEKTKQAVKGSRSAGAHASLGVCMKCGAPRRSTALFCGKCGYQFAESVVDEVKDQLNDKVEDAVVEKVEALLDPEKDDETEDTASQGGDASQKAKSKKNPSSKDKSLSKTGAKNVGKGTASSKKKAVPKRRTKCPNCGRRIQASWKFCPDCSQDLELVCPSCGNQIEPEWKYCPYCTEKL
jgi:hypothetical protein